MNNPFELITEKLTSIEKSILALKQSNQVETVEQEDKLLNIQETAEFLNLTVPTIYSKVSKGELPVMKLGKRLYFSKSELLECIKAGKRKTNTEIEAEADAYLSKDKGGLNNGK